MMLSACPSLAQVHKREIDLKAADGTLLKTTYVSPGRPGPGVVLLHMCDRGQRRVWDTLAAMLAARGVHVIAMDYRGFGESGGEREHALPLAERRRVSFELWPGDIDTVFESLVAQPGVDRARIGAAGGSCGAWNAVQLARRRPEITTLVLLAGGGTPAEEFLPRVPWMPVFGVAAHDDPGAVAQMRRILGSSTGARNRLKEYATGGHGTDLFLVHKELEPMIADWFVEHLITKPVQRAP
jgi:dienelactone hydrolase